MTNSLQLQKTVDTLFHLFEQGEWDEAAKLFAKDAQIIQQFGKNITAITIHEFVSNAKHGPLSKLGNPVYLVPDRKHSPKEKESLASAF